MNVEKRQEIERIVVRHLIRTMKKHGWEAYAVDDGGDEPEKCRTEADVMELVFGVDEATIGFIKRVAPKPIMHRVLIVLGNDGWDAIADYSFSDSDDFGKIMELEIDPYCDALCEKYANISD